MKKIILSCVAVLVSGCSSVEPYRINSEENSTLRCIRRASWEPLEKQGGDFPISPGGLVVLKNLTGRPVLYDFMPWWGDMDNVAVGPTSGILSGSKPKTYIPEGNTAGIRILEPFFFRDGALLTIWIKSEEQEDAEKWVTLFDFLRFQRITGEQMGDDRLTVTIEKEANNGIQPTK